jgi:hypothetical protein
LIPDPRPAIALEVVELAELLFGEHENSEFDVLSPNRVLFLVFGHAHFSECFGAVGCFAINQRFGGLNILGELLLFFSQGPEIAFDLEACQKSSDCLKNAPKRIDILNSG